MTDLTKIARETAHYAAGANGNCTDVTVQEYGKHSTHCNELTGRITAAILAFGTSEYERGQEKGDVG